MSSEGKELEKLDASLGRILRTVFLNSRNVGVGSALLASLGMSAYSTLSPEQEARMTYETLRPVVQKNANDLALLQAQLEALHFKHAELKKLLEQMLESQRLLEDRFSTRSKKADVKNRYNKLIEKLGALTSQQPQGEGPPPPQLPEAPWSPEE